VLFAIETWPGPRALWGDEIMYADLARRLAAREDARIDFLWPPGYPRFLAGLLVMGGGSFLLARCVQVGLLVLSAGLLRDLGLRLFGSRVAADVAAALLLLDPQVAGFAHFLWPEVVHLFLFLAALWILVARGERPGWLAVLGVVLALALLMKSVLAPFLPLLLFPAVRSAGLRGLGRVALVLATLAVTLTPTVIANARRGGPLVADSSRFNLWVGLNDRSRKDLVDEVVGREYQKYLRSGETFRERARVLDGQVDALVRERGVLPILRVQLSRQYFRLLDKDSFVTDQLPGGAIARQGYGYRGTPAVLAALLRAWSYGLYALVLVAATLGVAVDPPRGRAWRWVLLSFVAYNLAAFLVLHVKSRYRIAFLPVLDLQAGALAAWWAAGGTRARVGPLALGMALALAAVALLMAFAGPLLD